MLSACGGGGSGESPVPLTQRSAILHGPSLKNPIRHIVVIIQENRSFDDIFGGPNGFPGADTASSGTMSNGQTVQLAPVSLVNPTDINHSHQSFENQYAGGNMYFDLGMPPGQQPSFPYAYIPYSETVPYWTLARQYALADQMFASNSGPSYVAHQYLVAAQSGGQYSNGVFEPVDENPQTPGQAIGLKAWGCDDPSEAYVPVLGSDGKDHDTGLFPCFTYTTIADELDAANASWRYYAPAIGTSGAIWSAFDANSQIRYGNDWTQNIISPNRRILKDAAEPLADVTWVVPTFQNSDHSGSGSKTGPDWVANVVNVIGQSPNWKSTVIFILWDDWGGWYDHVPPPQLDEMGLGFRVPLIVVSPYAKTGYVSHVQHEFGSLLHFTEETFGLPALDNVDQRADDLSDCFNFSQHPRRFVKIQTQRTKQFFLRQPPDHRVPDND